MKEFYHHDHLCGEKDEAHAMFVTKMDGENEYIILRNSYGRKYGDNGYLRLAFSFVIENGAYFTVLKTKGAVLASIFATSVVSMSIVGGFKPLFREVFDRPNLIKTESDSRLRA